MGCWKATHSDLLSLKFVMPCAFDMPLTVRASLPSTSVVSISTLVVFQTATDSIATPPEVPLMTMAGVVCVPVRSKPFAMLRMLLAFGRSTVTDVKLADGITSVPYIEVLGLDNFDETTGQKHTRTGPETGQ